MSDPDVLIVGGGISGLATAYYLGQQGLRSAILEKSRPGGLIRTDLVQGCRLEAGPDSYLAAKPAVAELASGLGDLGNQIISSNDAARRVFIVRRSQLVPLPRGMVMMVPGEWLPALRSDLFGWGTRLRFLAERFARPRDRGDVSVGEFVSEHFGREVLEYITEPLLAGVYGGEAARLSAQSVLPRFVEWEKEFGSLIQGARANHRATPGGLFRSFRDGMQSLTDALLSATSDFSELLYAEAGAVSREGALWRVRAGEASVSAPHLVLACPTYAGAQLLEKTAPNLAAELAAVPYSSAILVTLLYRAADFHHPLDGFGFLVPPAERRFMAAATWINTKFPSRVAPGLVALRAFLVGSDAVHLENASDAELTRLAAGDFDRLMGISALPQTSVVARWPRSMPQYVVGHAARVERINEYCREQPGLHLVGNAYDGVGIPDCVRLAKIAASRIAAAF